MQACSKEPLSDGDLRRWQSVGPLAWDEYDAADIPGVGILWVMNGSDPLLFPDAAT